MNETQAVYNGCQFRSKLEATWAAFFDLAGWKWERDPVDHQGWIPNFRVTFQCEHSECNGDHTLLVEVKPYSDMEKFTGHPCMDYAYGGSKNEDGGIGVIPADGSAAFGANPSVTRWEISHGAGGGIEDVYFRVPNADELWKAAGKKVSVTKNGII